MFSTSARPTALAGAGVAGRLLVETLIADVVVRNRPSPVHGRLHGRLHTQLHTVRDKLKGVLATAH